MNMFFLIGCLLFSVMGCNDEKEKKEPAPKNEDLFVIQYPELSLDDELNAKAKNKQSLEVKRNTEYAVEGIVTISEEIDLKEAVTHFAVKVIFFDENGGVNVADIVLADLEKLSSGKYKFRSEHKALKRAGDYTIRIRLDAKDVFDTKFVVK